MSKHTTRKGDLIDRITTFILMISWTLETKKGRQSIEQAADMIDKAKLLVRIGFKIVLFAVVLFLLFFIKKWMFG
jgi:hypothetical protein